jgi:hypothetical protein
MSCNGKAVASRSSTARRFSFAGAKVRIYQAHDGRISLYYGETRLQRAAMPGG